MYYLSSNEKSKRLLTLIEKQGSHSKGLTPNEHEEYLVLSDLCKNVEK